MQKNKLYLSFTVICTITLFTSLITAQVKKATISGHITNIQTGKPIPDANITINNTKYGTSSNDGGYYFLLLPEGIYSITVSVIGYETKTIEGIDITSVRRKNVDIELKPSVIRMNPVIVSATLSPHLKDRVAVSSEVFTEFDFSEMNGSTAAELLKPATGVLIKSTGGLAGLNTISIRGSNDSQVLVLLDGQRMNVAQSGGVDLNLIPQEVIETIEVVRGGHSALMGSDAIGGVVNLISKESLPPKGFLYSFESKIGSFGTKRIHLYGSQRIGMFKTFVSYNYTRSDGKFKYIDPSTDSSFTRKNNHFNGRALFIKSQIDLSKKSQLQIIHNTIWTERGVPGSISFLTPLASRNDLQTLSAIRYRNQILNNLSIKMRLYNQSTDQKYKDPGGWQPIDSRHKNNILGSELRIQWGAARFLKITSGGELRTDDLRSSDVNNHKRITKSLFSQIEIEQARPISGSVLKLRVVPAVRWDSYSDVQSQFCPKLAVMISAGNYNRIALHTNISRSFRAPSFNDLYWPDDGFSHGNESLKPEIGESFDIGLTFTQFRFGHTQLEINYFRNNIKDLIQWLETEPWVWSPQNVGRARIVGIENIISFRHPRNLFYIKLSHTWMKAVDITSGSENKGRYLIYRPKLKFDISGGITISSFHLNLNYRMVGKRYCSEDNSKSLPQYSLINGNIGVNLNLFKTKFDLKLEVINLLNRSIFFIKDYPLPGREVMFSLRICY